MVHAEQKTGDRYEIMVYGCGECGEDTCYLYTADADDAYRYASLNGGCTVIDMKTGDTRMWL